MKRDLFWLTDEQFSKIAPHLPTDTRGKAHVDDRRVISGIVHVLKSGGRWIDAPPEYGPKKTLYNRYVRWAEKGVWLALFQALAKVINSQFWKSSLRSLGACFWAKAISSMSQYAPTVSATYLTPSV
jgi:transposase